jgi:hypothetical protein
LVFLALEEDYYRVRQLMKRWELVPKKLPFEKFVVLVLGSTSAGIKRKNEKKENTHILFNRMTFSFPNLNFTFSILNFGLF